MTTFEVGDKVRVNSDVHGEVMNYAGGEGVIVHIAANDNSTLYTVEGIVDFMTIFHAHELDPAPTLPVTDAAALRTALAGTVYTLEVASYEYAYTLGIYTTREQAEADMRTWVMQRNVMEMEDFPDEPDFWWKEQANQEGQGEFKRNHEKVFIDSYHLNQRVAEWWALRPPSELLPSDTDAHTSTAAEGGEN